MKHTDAIKKIMIDTNVSQVDLMKQIGLKSRSAISSRINQDNISVKAMLEILDAMGYELVVRESFGTYELNEYPIRLQDYER